MDPLKRVHLHFKHVKEMASISAAVTVFCRQAGDVCLCDTDKIYLAADTTAQPVLQGTVAPKGVTESQKQSVSILKSDKWCVQDHLDTQETQFKNHIVTVMQLKKQICIICSHSQYR